MRVSRVWRDISARIQAGYGHHPEEPLEPGGLAIFCPACPQPGVNLPDNWREDAKRYAKLLGATKVTKVYMQMAIYEEHCH